MAYIKTVYVNDSEPAISADNLNKSENELEFLDNSTTDLKAYKTDNVYGGATTDYAQTVTTGKAWNSTYGEPSDNNNRAIVGAVAVTPDMKSLTIASGYTMIIYGNNAGQGSALTTVRNYSSTDFDLTTFSYKYLFITIARNDLGDITSDDMTNKVKISKYDSAIPFVDENELTVVSNDINERIDTVLTEDKKQYIDSTKLTDGKLYQLSGGSIIESSFTGYSICEPFVLAKGTYCCTYLYHQYSFLKKKD